MGSVLAETLGRQLLHSDIWFLADKCANLVKRIHEPLERSVAVLDNILTIEDDDTNRQTAAGAQEVLRQNRINHNNIRPPVAQRPNVLNDIMEQNIQVVDDYFNRQLFSNHRGKTSSRMNTKCIHGNAVAICDTSLTEKLFVLDAGGGEVVLTYSKTLKHVIACRLGLPTLIHFPLKFKSGTQITTKNPIGSRYISLVSNYGPKVQFQSSLVGYPGCHVASVLKTSAGQTQSRVCGLSAEFYER